VKPPEKKPSRIIQNDVEAELRKSRSKETCRENKNNGGVAVLK